MQRLCLVYFAGQPVPSAAARLVTFFTYSTIYGQGVCFADTGMSRVGRGANVTNCTDFKIIVEAVGGRVRFFLAGKEQPDQEKR